MSICSSTNLPPLRYLKQSYKMVRKFKWFHTHLQLETCNLTLGPASFSRGDRVARPLDASGSIDIISLMVVVLDLVLNRPHVLLFSATIRYSNSSGFLYTGLPSDHMKGCSSNLVQKWWPSLAKLIFMHIGEILPQLNLRLWSLLFESWQNPLWQCVYLHPCSRGSFPSP